MKLPELRIGKLVAKYPIIQGGMGVGVSRSNLAGTVAACGGVGVISTAQIGFDEPDFQTNTKEANLRSLAKHIKKAKEIAGGNGIVGINIMCVLNNYVEQVKTAIEAGIDLIISGAGLPKQLPEYVKGSKVKIAPIISSARGAVLMTKMWITKHDYIPDMIVVEGPEAGGHLGFSKEELEAKEKDIYQIGEEVIKAIKPFEEKYQRKIPIILAGGIYTGRDIAKAINLGAAGVQMASRFVATDECDAHENFKKAYIQATKEEIEIVQSPVGMPGRAIRNSFIKQVKDKPSRVTKCLNCIKTCEPAQTPYCITQALINSVKGDVDNGLVFCGSTTYRIKNIVPVKELMRELITEAEIENK